MTTPTFFKRLSFRIPPQRGNPGLKLIAFSPSLCAGTGFFSLVLCVGGGGGVCVGADGVLLGALSLWFETSLSVNALSCVVLGTALGLSALLSFFPSVEGGLVLLSLDGSDLRPEFKYIRGYQWKFQVTKLSLAEETRLETLDAFFYQWHLTLQVIIIIFLIFAEKGNMLNLINMTTT